MGVADIPPIAGRSPSYMVRQMWDMQQGTRNSEPAKLMKLVLDNLTPEDMVAIAAYVSSRVPPAIGLPAGTKSATLHRQAERQIAAKPWSCVLCSSCAFVHVPGPNCGARSILNTHGVMSCQGSRLPGRAALAFCIVALHKASPVSSSIRSRRRTSLVRCRTTARV
jgi:hypothetical protein